MNTKTLLRTASAFTLALAATTFTATPALPDDCLPDRDNDGGANSGRSDLGLACGVAASAGATNSTAIGAPEDSSGDNPTPMSASSLESGLVGKAASLLVQILLQSIANFCCTALPHFLGVGESRFDQEPIRFDLSMDARACFPHRTARFPFCWADFGTPGSPSPSRNIAVGHVATAAS